MKRVQAEQKNRKRTFLLLCLALFFVFFWKNMSVVKATDASSATNTFITEAKETPTPPEPEEKVTISGKKTWVDDKDAAGARPRSITIYIYQNDKKLRMLVITENDDWKWSVTLPKYDSAGNEIAYRLEEKSVPNYKTEIKGYNITNTYIGRKNPDKETADPDQKQDSQQPDQKSEDSAPTRSDAARTGDTMNWQLWYGVMLIALLAFRQLFYRAVRGRWKWKK